MSEKRDPIVDVVMLVHSQASWADLAIRAVEHHTKNPYRLIIVSMAAEGAAKKVIDDAEKRGHTVVRLAENRSFSSGVNAGVGTGTSRFIAVLNDDALVTEGWDSALLQDAQPKHVGMVGARSNYASGAQMDPNFVGEPPYLVFVLVALRRDVWNAVGPMDEVTFDGFSTEDIDYSWRVRKAGYQLALSKAFVLHAGSRSLAATIGNDPLALAKNNEKYNARLKDKWGKEWTEKHSKLYGKGLVTSYHADAWTRVDFMQAMLGLRRGAAIPFEVLQVQRAPIHMARQMACDYAVDNGFDWILQLDDDATFPPDIISKLLAHQKDVVTALAYQRKTPHWPCIFELAEDGLLGKPMEGVERTGLRRVDVSGFHCSLTKTSVIKRLREGTKKPDGSVDVPGTRIYFGGFDNKLGEDFAFSINCKKIGIQIYCDTDIISGHIGAAMVVDETYKKLFAAGAIPSELHLRR